MLETHESMKDMAHASSIYSPIVDIHSETVSRLKEASERQPVSYLTKLPGFRL